MSEHDVHTRRENARAATGRFGIQEHTEPETELAALPDFRSRHARLLDAQLTDLRQQRDILMEERREEHLLDIARKLPADVRRITFRAEYDRDGERNMLLFDNAENDIDVVQLDPALTDHLYGVALDFGTPGDFVADEWLANEDDGYYWVDLDEETALRYADEFRSEVNNSMFPDTTMRESRSIVTWTERAIRARASSIGFTEIHLRINEENGGVSVVSFQTAGGTIAPYDESDSDHRFIAAQAESIPARSDSLTTTGRTDAPLRLGV